ncbi:hypothetical protein A2U01_0056063, partial [Trifolium medium]|nr:hypothetical protein [Trifolium medium]
GSSTEDRKVVLLKQLRLGLLLRFAFKLMQLLDLKQGPTRGVAISVRGVISLM